jgi:hypothetical protein
MSPHGIEGERDRSPQTGPHRLFSWLCQAIRPFPPWTHYQRFMPRLHRDKITLAALEGRGTATLAF